MTSGVSEILAGMRNQAQPRFLVVSNKGIGDLICDSVLVSGIRRRLSQAQITALVRGPAETAVFGNAGGVDEFLFFDTDDQRYWRNVARLLLHLWKRPLDAVCFSTGTDGVKAPLLSLWTRARYRVGEKSSALAAFYTHAVAFRPEQHKVESNWDILAAMGIPERPWPKFPVRPQDRRAIDNFLTSLGLDGGPLIGIHPGSGMMEPHKRWPAERFVQLANLLTAARGKLIFLGGPEEKSLSEEISRAVRGATYNVAGKLTLGQLAALMERLTVVIGNDSGPLHVANAVGTPTVTLFGPTSPRRTRPYGERAMVLQTRMSCSPCYPQLRQGCGAPVCLLDIEVDQVRQCLERFF